jgi:KaiC/GvpD/RAD55 family RecA-like ATPase
MATETNAAEGTPEGRVSTGVPVLDDMLDGGLPERRSVLLTGGPGTGKSTLAMNFLQQGLDDGDSALFLSTEQTVDELRGGFKPFDFDLDHPDLELATLHAVPRENRQGEQELVIRTLGGDADIDDKQVPFTGENVVKYLARVGDHDRIVFDSVSGLEPIAEDRETFRRVVMDLIREFNDDFEATTVFTAEYAGNGGEGKETVGGPDTVQYNAHGVIRVWREAVDGDYQRFIDVMKMRGVDHDSRQYKIGFDESGPTVYPAQRSQSERFVDYERFQTGLEGLDELLGGGLLQGTGTLLEHDGQASLDALFAALLGAALDDDMAITLVPRIDMKPRQLDKLLYATDATTDALLDGDRLFVLDMVGAWGSDHRNVFDVMDADSGLPYLLNTIDERASGDGTFTMINTEAKVHAIGDEEARRLRDWQEAHYLGDDDLLLEVHNPDQMNDQLSEFHVDAAGQVLETYMGDSGLQYLTLHKSPTGMLGTTRLVAFTDAEPFVRVRRA